VGFSQGPHRKHHKVESYTGSFCRSVFFLPFFYFLLLFLILNYFLLFVSKVPCKRILFLRSDALFETTPSQQVENRPSLSAKPHSTLLLLLFCVWHQLQTPFPKMHRALQAAIPQVQTGNAPQDTDSLESFPMISKCLEASIFLLHAENLGCKYMR